MGFYRRCVLPALIRLSMRNRELTARRKEIVPKARGRVLEIGIGPGLNLPFYGADVSELDAVDPSPELLRTARDTATAVSFPVRLHEGSAEQLPFAAGTFDTAVMTWTLCSIPDPAKALREIRRVLKASGRLLFVEHGLSPDPAVAKWQRRLEPAWLRLSGGCHLSRKIDDLVRAAGFRIDHATAGYLPSPRLFAWGAFTYEGEARS